MHACEAQGVCRYLKHPIFAQHNLIALATPALIGINCGIVYSQHAHPSGPTTWAAYQVPDRTMRWLEDQTYILALLNATGKPGKLQDIGFEQSVYNDAVWSIVSGKPFFGHSMRPDYDPHQMSAWEQYHKSIGPDFYKTLDVRPLSAQQVCCLISNTDHHSKLFDWVCTGRSAAGNCNTSLHVPAA